MLGQWEAWGSYAQRREESRNFLKLVGESSRRPCMRPEDSIR